MRRSIAIKTIAFILCVISLMTTVFSVLGITVLISEEFYTKPIDSIREESAERILRGYAPGILEMALKNDEQEIKSFNNSRSFRFYIQQQSSSRFYTNYKGEQCDFVISFDFYSPASEDDTKRPIVLGTTDSNMEKYMFTAYILKEHRSLDELSIADALIKSMYAIRFAIYIIGGSALLLFIISLIILCCCAGWKKNEDKPRTCFFDKIPFDIFTVIYFSAACIALIPILDFYFEGIEIAAVAFGLTLLYSVMFTSYMFSLAARAKTGELFKNTVIGMFFSAIFRGTRFILRAISSVFLNLPAYAKTLLICCFIFLAQLVAFIFAINGNEILALFLFLILGTFVAVIAFYITYAVNKLIKGCELIANGVVDHRINASYLTSSFKKHASNLNNIGGGLSLALEEKLKSERFKTELITNVSHDLKTPLTSIVSYVDLIKTERRKEQPDEEKLTEYIDVLDRQSAKLRKLTEDLVEASKAQAGNLEVTPTQIELGEMLAQTRGEYEEKLASLGLKLIVHVPEAPVTVMADGKHLWRIFENLMNNICKYALEGTRVYVSIAETEGHTLITFRNTSKYELNVSAEELTERFVRGDASRNSEGSGLGLSIARSLAELNGARLDIYTDGDLFKVVIDFQNSRSKNEPF